MAPLGFPKPCRPLGYSWTRCSLRNQQILCPPCPAPEIRVQRKQILHQPSGAILRALPREQGENHEIPEGVGLGGTWKLPGLSGTSGCPVPSSVPVSTPPTGSEALRAFPLSLKHPFTFQLSKPLKKPFQLFLGSLEGKQASSTMKARSCSSLQSLSWPSLSRVSQPCTTPESALPTEHLELRLEKRSPIPTEGTRQDLLGMCW